MLSDPGLAMPPIFTIMQCCRVPILSSSVLSTKSLFNVSEVALLGYLGLTFLREVLFQI